MNLTGFFLQTENPTHGQHLDVRGNIYCMGMDERLLAGQSKRLKKKK